ncbi:MAG: rane protein of unknown function [Candidatus Saccharibacteria bacterium]|jgi:hypothetical protein|nr:rane protein of unknown function [Candidatus Saccharibacteria bacterium]
MEFLKSSKRRSLISELVYIGLNVAFAVTLLIILLVIESPLPAFALVLLSKWRILAVRPRYWFVNILTNLVDLIVSLSIVILIYTAGGAIGLQIVLTALYIAWLLYVKPKSKRSFVAIQAGAAVFLGVSALMTVSYDWIASLVVLAMWLIGYSAARHVVSSYDEPHASFYSLVWGLVFAELGWLAYHWTFAYAIPGAGDIKLSQVALISLAISFLAERAYTSYVRHGSIRSSDIIMPTLLSVSVIIILLTLFNMISTGVI